MRIILEQEILKENKDQADKNRKCFNVNKVLVINLIGSPGAGKTTVLEKTIEKLKKDYRIAVIEGDIYTTKDAERIQNCGVEVVQINTSGVCHLSAKAIESAVQTVDLKNTDILFIENVGNLICPAEYDLGEDAKIAVLSTTEGDDKPSKYPMIFQEAPVVLLNKCDLLPYINFNMETAEKDLATINKDAKVIHMSAFNDSDMDQWIEWIKDHVK
ncbi:hydrogenase nickel incorporation protein HypB [Aminipila terrae]|uniref:Hydrogenase nickel incorporation protein HypB n=1 Tax=Aminipila terrae TaxID=2697030 RepID=A0A6P1MFR0_9FIRM|nr:hydrogenase nickel incorporation protein HypB [Aminipila terrae]QHI73549.1 hydrogenase nickel incorporation protein HypB [Aminipila terrae]